MWLVETNSTVKTVKVPESQAEGWDKYLEENPEVDSLSHLIRLSVDRELNDSYDDRGGPFGNGESQSEPYLGKPSPSKIGNKLNALH